MSCLGERLTALVDGELGHEERELALAHLAFCDRCRKEADALRRLKSRLRGLSDLPVAEGADDAPTGDFMARLMALGEPGGPAAPAERPAPPARPARPVRPRASRPHDNRPAARATAPAGRAGAAAHALSPERRRRALAVGAATLAIGLGAVSYAAGGRPAGPTVSPAFEQFTIEHALVSGDAPMPDPLTDTTSVPVAPEP
ncbi:anti-sigma factor family protein [Actinomadura namibiensis]|uniref:Anti-sigma factor RsiW n=2 Tax=Actinomadura TaxID=1988 RepID=A0A7W3QJB7_ACTNM|nr:zf-HC2 domain-containing protein [Actinomadura namibiensis]MBA8948763.1 anti-sigma factor RsiW [Actinomadura namibiensis]